MPTKIELTPVQLGIIQSIENAASLGEAITQSPVQRETVTEWRKTNPAFNEALERAMRDRAVVNQERIQTLVWDAITVVKEVLTDKKASPSVRLRAAQMVFKLAAQGTKLEPVASAEPAAVSEPATPKTSEKIEIMHNPAQSTVRLAQEPSRNSLCPCKSGLKFKRCCASQQTAPPTAAAA